MPSGCHSGPSVKTNPVAGRSAVIVSRIVSSPAIFVPFDPVLSEPEATPRAAGLSIFRRSAGTSAHHREVRVSEVMVLTAELVVESNGKPLLDLLGRKPGREHYEPSRRRRPVGSVY